jgi:ubiquinone/menaquinone biosynthesis C-methylase UbiE
MPGRISDALWAPLFARVYDRSSQANEDAGVGERRRALLARAHGRTLELGAGTGVNLEHYPETVSELVLTEPDEHMRAQLLRKGADAVAASAERLPFPDASFDTVVATMMLCSVEQPDTVLAEVARVLRPGGSLLFLEHVRSEDPELARKQDRWARPWSWVGRGCHPNRDTLATIRASGLDVVDVERAELPKGLPIVRPLIVGEARR